MYTTKENNMAIGSTADIGIRIFIDNSASGALDLVSRQISDVGKQSSIAKDLFGSLGQTIATGVFFGSAAMFAVFAAAIAFSAVKAGELQTAMDKVQLATGLTREQMIALTPWLVNLGANSVFSISELADGVAILGQNGFKTSSQIKDMSGAAVNLSEATGSSAVEGFKLLSTVMQAWNINADQANQTADLLFFSFEHGTPDVAGMTAALGRLGGEARILNIPLAGMIPLLDVISQQLGSTSVAGNALLYFLTRVASPTAAGAKEMKALGISVYDASGHFIGINKTIDEFYAKLLNLTPAQQAIAITDMFGARGSQAIKAVMTGFASYDTLTEKLAVSHNAVGSSAAAAALRMAELGNQVKVFTSNISDAAAFIGTALVPMLSGLLSHVNSAVASFRLWAQANGDVAAKFLLLGVAIAGVIMIAAGIMLLSNAILIMMGIAIGVGVAIAGLVFAIEKLPGALFNAATSATPLGAVLRMLWGIGTDISTFFQGQFTQTWKDVQNAMKPLGPAFSELGTALRPLLPVLQVLGGVVLLLLVASLHAAIQAVSVFITGFAMLLSGVIQVVTGIITFVVQFFNLLRGQFTGNQALVTASWNAMGRALLQIINGALEAILGVIVGTLGTILAAIGGFVHGVISFFENMSNMLVGHSIVPDMMNAIKNVFTSAFSYIIGHVMSFASSLLSIVGSAMNNARNYVVNGLNAMVGAVASGFSSIIVHVVGAGFQIINSILGAWNGARNAAVGGVNGIVGVVASLPGRIAGALSGLWSSGYNAMSQFANGLGAAIGQIISRVQAAASAVAGFLEHHSPAKMGPLADDDKWMPNMMSMLASGIERSTPMLTKAAGGAAAGLANIPSIQRVTSAVAGSGGGNVGVGNLQGNITINLDGKVIYQNTLTRMQGDMQVNGIGRSFR